MKATNEEYVGTMGLRCPFCGSANISGAEWEGDISSQKVACDDCDKEWWDRYELIGFEEIGRQRRV